jgi:hypothetical protein
MTSPLPEPLFTPRAAAVQLGLSVKNIMAHVTAGRLKVHPTLERRPARWIDYGEKPDDLRGKSEGYGDSMSVYKRGDQETYSFDFQVRGH